MMIITWSMDGNVYHKFKPEFKKIRDEIGGKDLKYMGFNEMAWRSSTEYIKLNAERDTDDSGYEYTKHVTLTWEGDERTKLLTAMCKLFDPISERSDEGELVTPGQEKNRKIDSFDNYTNNKTEEMKRGGAPEGFINSYLKDREKQRKGLTEDVKDDSEESDDRITWFVKDGDKIVNFLKEKKMAYSLDELIAEFSDFKEHEIRVVLDKSNDISIKIVEGVNYYGVL